MTASSGEKALVLHNVGTASVTLSLPDDKLDNKLVSLGVPVVFDIICALIFEQCVWKLGK